MPEHTLPDALHPQQEDAADELQLRGGLKGRFFADFCLLQSTVDALQNYLVHAATPDVVCRFLSKAADRGAGL